MSGLTERENALKVYAGEMPDWVPVASKAISVAVPIAYIGEGGPGSGMQPGTIVYNLLKTPHVIPPDNNTGPMPVPGDPQVKDITRWREYIDFPFPDPHDLDWSMDREVAKTIDRDNRLVQAMFGGASFSGSPYNAMVDVMGHEAASIAMLDDDQKESWHELIGYLTDMEVAVVEMLAEIYQPDVICTADDLSNAHSLFMSPQTYREMVKPYQARIVQAILDVGCIAELHCCGKGDLLVDDWYEIGIRAWNPAQVFNDLAGVKAKYGRSFVLSGGYDSQSKINAYGAKEADVRASIRDSFAKYAPGGAYVFSTSGMALAHELGEEHMGWILDEALKCSAEAYRQ
jgi:hypothetical protein